MLAGQSKDGCHHCQPLQSVFSLLTSAGLRGGDLLDCLDPPSCGDHNDLLPPSSPDDLLAGARSEDLLLPTAWLVDDDGLLPSHCGHLHPGLHLTGAHSRPNCSDLSGSSGRFVDN